MNISLNNKLWRTAVVSVVAAGTFLGTACAPETPPANPEPQCATYNSEAATASLQVTTSTIGGTVRLTGTNWLHPTDGGSTIAVKIDEGAFSRLPGDLVHPNATVWQLVEVDCTGTFDAIIQLPTASNSTPEFTAGEHSLRLLTGSIKAGDAPRTVGPITFTVG